MQVKVNETLSNPVETLKFCGYDNPVQLDGNIYNVDSIGVAMDAIEVLTSEKNKYGELITKLREEKGMSLETLSDILVMSPERLAAIEDGTAYMSPSELSMCGSIFNISSEALKKGQIENPLDMQREINNSVIDILASAIESQNELLEYIYKDDFERFQVKTRIDNDAASIKYGYAVYDTETDSFVADEKGAMIICDNFEDAFNLAAEKEYALDEVSEKLDELTDNLKRGLRL